ncbi:MAG: hypothetical protein V7707_13400 [Motiliproteus sp.]
MVKFTGLVLLVMSLYGCTGYQPMSSSGTGMGYQDSEAGESAYLLRYVGHQGFSNDQDAWQRIEGFWDQRAAELCGSERFERSDMEKNKPCRTYTTFRGDNLVREERCLLELKGKLTC